MPKHGCPDWDYETHKDRAILQRHLQELLVDIFSKQLDMLSCCADTRPLHARLFSGLTPSNHSYYAGHYRGQKGCLIDYEVKVNGDPMVGTASLMVPHEMARFGKILTKRLIELTKLSATLTILHDPAYHVAIVVRITCQAFVELLTIHPYANGNGHAARTLLVLILSSFGYTAQQWTIDPRPPFTEYASLIAAHRRGNIDLLEQHILSTLAVLK